MAAAPLQLSPPTAGPQPAYAGNREFDLLLACCAPGAQGAGNERIEQVIECGLRWELLLRIAEHHGVSQLVFRRLAPFYAVIPKEILAAFTRMQQINSRRSLWLTRELLRVAGKFKQAGIGFLAYKGPSLAELLYGDVAMRQFGDLDFLVFREDVGRAMTAARQLGYTPRLALRENQEKAFLSIGYERAFDSQFGRNLLEIKWKVLPPFYAIDFDVEKLFLRSDFIYLEGASVPTPCGEDLLLLLCVHAAKHGWEKLSWLCDLALLSRRVLDWGSIEKQARQLGIQRILAINFILAEKFLQASTPGAVAAYVQRDSRVISLANGIASGIAASRSCDVASGAYFRGFTGLREARIDRARFWWRLITVPGVGEWETVRLRDPRSRVYRAVRIWRLVKKAMAGRAWAASRDTSI